MFMRIFLPFFNKYKSIVIDIVMVLVCLFVPKREKVPKNCPKNISAKNIFVGVCVWKCMEKVTHK